MIYLELLVRIFAQILYSQVWIVSEKVNFKTVSRDEV